MSKLPTGYKQKPSRKPICVYFMPSCYVKFFLFHVMIPCSTSVILLPVSGWWTSENQLKSATPTSTRMPLAELHPHPLHFQEVTPVCTNQLQAAKQGEKIPSFIVIVNIDMVIIVLSVHNKSCFSKRVGGGGVMWVLTEGSVWSYDLRFSNKLISVTTGDTQVGNKHRMNNVCITQVINKPAFIF